MNDILENFLWAIFGVLLDRGLDVFVVPNWAKHEKKVMVNKRKKLYYSEKTNRKMMEYYRGSLYNCNINGVSKQIPFLTNDVWSNISVDVFDTPDLLKFVRTTSCNYPIRKRMLNKRIRNGQILIDNPSLFLHSVIVNSSGISFEAGEYSYFRRISFTNDFEEETYKWLHGIKKGKTPLRDKFLPPPTNANTVSPNTVPLGCDAVVAILKDGMYHICIHERSEQTVNYPGGVMVVPSFGFGDVNGISNPVLYSFLKEYSEELFNREEMENTTRKVNPEWFYDEYDEVNEIMQMHADNKIKLVLNGCGYDAIGGFFNLSLLALIDDPEMTNRIFRRCCGNWETSNNSIRFVPLISNELSNLLEQNILCPTTAYAIDRAINWIKKHR